MSLNCLSCQLLQRSDSEREDGQRQEQGQGQGQGQGQQNYYADEFESPERSWSGNLRLRAYENRGGFRVMAEKKVAPKGHRRLHSTGGVSFGKEPRLIRSSGMRRDWSFEDLRTLRDDNQPSSIS